MRYTRLMLAASLAMPAVAVLAGTALADVVGAKPIAVDGYKYGGALAVGADKNLDAVRILIRAADAMGQLRDNGPAPIQYVLNPPDTNYLVLGDTTLAMRIDADGTWNGVKSHVVLDWDYGAPGVRLDVASADGKSRKITVAAPHNLAWNEKTPGVYAGAAETSANERLIVAFLLPTEVIQEARDAANVMKASKDATGHDVLTIPIPKLGPNVTNVVTFDADAHPIHSSIAYNGHTYTGDFGDFLGDRMDMMVNFSHHVVLKTDGQETANLALNWHQPNPYLVFPVPAEVAAK